MKFKLRLDIISTLPINSTFVYTDETTRTLLFKKVKNSKEITKRLKINIQNFTRYRNGERGMPLSLFLDLLKYSGETKEIFQNNIKLRIGKSGVAIKIGPYIYVDGEWIYIAELIRGDGHVKKNLWGLYFVNKEIDLINIVRNFFMKLGIPKESMRLSQNKGIWSLEIRSKLLALIFWKIFNISPGKREESRLPKFYFNIEYVPSAIRGAFDAEGSVQIGKPSPRRITISSKSRLWLTDLQFMLGELKINSIIRKEERYKSFIYRLYVYGQTNLKRFHNFIMPNHRRRSGKLQLLLKTYNTKRAVEGKVTTMLLESLRASGPLKRISLSKKLSINKNRLSWYLNSLQQKQLINVVERTYTSKGSYYTYGITELGIKKLSEDWSLR